MEEIKEEEIFEAPKTEENSEVLTEKDEIDFINAVEVGKDSDKFDIFGNEVEMHTLSVRETLEASKAVKEYMDTDARWLAVKTSFIASAIDSINGQEFYRPIEIGENEAKARFKRLSKNYYADFVNECYAKYEELEKKQRDMIEKLKKAKA